MVEMIALSLALQRRTLISLRCEEESRSFVVDVVYLNGGLNTSRLW